MKTAADISLSGAVFTMGLTSSQLVQSPSENDIAGVGFTPNKRPFSDKNGPFYLNQFWPAFIGKRTILSLRDELEKGV